ncbi:M15 family metallopeptidase [Bacteroides sp.]|uniref:M15 family metallopeptidase n=1 Tax=Bacteroides sp. TaxID=29523 RepID=UPI002621C208|nr:M15 family metallopeptidase [Bacteroides sp.]
MKWILFIYVLFILSGCRQQSSSRSESGKDSLTKIQIEKIDRNDEENTPSVSTSNPISTKSKTALYLDSLGFINIAEADSSIVIELMYTRADNFTGEVLYEDLHEAYLHPDAMESLSKAQYLLKELHPDYSLIVYDAARPMSVQQKMWDVVKGTSKQIYVSNPARGGGLHNYGLAVDISILDEQGSPLSMGTPVDYLGKEAHITEEAQLVKSGKITEQEHANRLLLRRVMKDAGFRALPSEWWHFNRYNRQTAKERYQVIP